jgi:hypothetical protein
MFTNKRWYPCTEIQRDTSQHHTLFYSSLLIFSTCSGLFSRKKYSFAHVGLKFTLAGAVNVEHNS